MPAAKPTGTRSALQKKATAAKKKTAKKPTGPTQHAHDTLRARVDRLEQIVSSSLNIAIDPPEETE